MGDLPERPDEREPFSDEEVITLLRATKDTDWQGAILVAVWTGLRLADVASLAWQCVDLENGTLKVTPDKTDKGLFLPMAAELRAYLAARTKGVGKAPRVAAGFWVGNARLKGDRDEVGGSFERTGCCQAVGEFSLLRHQRTISCALRNASPYRLA